MSEILVLPDIHGRKFWKEAVEKYEDDVDKIVFLGDYLDPYPDEGINIEQAIENFVEILSLKEKNDEKVVLLLGNHDLHYLCKEFTRSTRYNSWHSREIKQLFEDDTKSFKIAHEEIVGGKRFLFTHAGVMRSWVERNKNLVPTVNAETLNELMDSKEGIMSLGELSSYRSWEGEDSGSPLWSDVREKIYARSTVGNIISNTDSIVDGIDYQIFGHTRLVKTPIICDDWACIDVSKAFLLNDDGKLEMVDFGEVVNYENEIE